jgi:hypothetical protein
MYPVREPQFFGAVPVRYLLDTGDVAIIVVFIVFGTIEATRAFLSAEPDLKPPQKPRLPAFQPRADHNGQVIAAFKIAAVLLTALSKLLGDVLSRASLSVVGPDSEHLFYRGHCHYRCRLHGTRLHSLSFVSTTTTTNNTFATGFGGTGY